MTRRNEEGPLGTGREKQKGGTMSFKVELDICYEGERTWAMEFTY